MLSVKGALGSGGALARAGAMQQPSRLAAASGVALALGASVAYCAWSSRRRRSACSMRVRVLYGSITGTSQKWAASLAGRLCEHAGKELPDMPLQVVVEDLTTFPIDSLFEKPQKSAGRQAEIVLVLMSTHSDGKPPPTCEHFCALLKDHVHDFRVDRDALAHLHFAVLGFGSSDYEAAGHFCTAATEVDAAFAALSAVRLSGAARVSDTLETEPQLAPWRSRVLDGIRRLAVGDALLPAAAQEGAEDEEDAESAGESDSDSTTVGSEAGGAKAGAADDVEELAESCAGTVGSSLQAAPREMVTKRHREQLTKEGYKIIGSHSAVKLCRWTKHQLRGRGGCYKHSFYGISSYQCMEATPSLACANKCVFCWRHHKNPTGTEWKWKMDEPDAIVAEGIEAHQRMIRECKGIPGVKKERWEAAMNVRHCALSLVGEPIMYPRINDFIMELHRRKISTFLVTNAQFPEAIENLVPVTQLYVSVDAGTKEALKAVDRPIFTDFWERYLDSLRSLAKKNQRTTYRLTLVKDHNMANAADYARLVALGDPDFIEIKSVTFCGESKASSLTMGNVPWHEEVKEFSELMLSHEGLAENYELACEHQHSNIVLIAHRRFKIQGHWHTWIDYDRFHELVAQGSAFRALDYALPTPEWAVYGAKEHGFDPADVRVLHNRTKKRAKEGLLSEAQLRQYNFDPAKA